MLGPSSQLDKLNHRVNNCIQSPGNCSIGLPQWCMPSSPLFVIYIRDLLDKVDGKEVYSLQMTDGKTNLSRVAIGGGRNCEPTHASIAARGTWLFSMKTFTQTGKSIH